MSLEEQIGKKEREIHALKGLVKAQKQARWINENYGDGKQKKELRQQIETNEKAIKTKRKELLNLLNQHFNN